MATCKSCGAQIEWIITPNGKKSPIDIKPVKVWVTDRGRVTEQGPWRLETGYVSHFSTCPNAARHRKKKVDPTAKNVERRREKLNFNTAVKDEMPGLF